MATPLVGPHSWALRKAVGAALANLPADALVLVGLSGGPDSLALAAALVATHKHSGAVIVDHGLQDRSAEIAGTAAEQARALGLDPVVVVRVSVRVGNDGIEAAARAARYAALRTAATDAGADAVVLAHTKDDVAESVLLGLARGSGAASLAQMRSDMGIFRRPLLELSRADTVGSCSELGLAPWHDPQNSDPSMLRARIRKRVLPMLEDQLGPGFTNALARTAKLLRQDADALAELSDTQYQRLAKRSAEGLCLEVAALQKLPEAIAARVIRRAAREVAHSSLHYVHVQAVLGLVTGWHGQGPLDLPGISARRMDGAVVLTGRDQHRNKESAQ